MKTHCHACEDCEENKKTAPSVTAQGAVNSSKLSRQNNKSILPQNEDAVKGENELQHALERISKITPFQVDCIDPEQEAARLLGGRMLLDFNFETGTCTLFTPLSTMKENIIKTAEEIERQERPNPRAEKDILTLIK